MTYSGRLGMAIFSLGALAFIAAGLFGICGMGMTMSDDATMPMAHCPFIPGSMNPLEHLAAWQGTFENVFKLQDATSLLLFLILAVFLIAAIRNELFFSFRENARSFHRYLNEASLLFTQFLEELFSSGVLNPKTF
jgi:hypothetical protein